jgi:hypothetical protein
MALSLDELKALYAEKGATTRREEETEQGTKYYDDPVQLGDGWTAYENQPQIIGYEGQGESATPIFGEVDPANKLGGFARAEGDKSYYYDTNGKLVHVEKTDTSFYDRFGPMIMAAMTMGGGSALLGNSLFGLTGNAAAGAGGALAGGVNAALTDQDILKGALKGGVGSAGALQLGDTGFTLGDVNKAINFAQNPSLAGAVNLASPYVPTNFDIGDTGFTTNDVLKSLNTAQALGSGDNKRIFDAITGLAKGTDFSGLTANEQAQLEANREIKRLNRIEDAVLNQPASDDGSTQGILDLINEMYPAANVMGMSEGQLANFLEANMNEIQGSADLETLLRSQGQPTADEGTVTVTGERPTGLGDFMVPTGDERIVTSGAIPKGNVVPVDNPEELVITGDRPAPYISNLRTKDIISDIKDDEVKIDKLFPDADINDILQTITAPGGTKTVVPGGTKTTTPGTTTTQQALSNLGLNAPMPSQDPYANIKLMEELFGGDTAYKLRSLGAPKNLASADIDALARMLRG